jgi:large subunit ribosomal protein L24
MKLRRDDNVMVMAGRDKGKTGRVLVVLPSDAKVVVEGINIAKRHTKPSDKNPRGGIIELTKAIDVSKVMVIDPDTKLPARIGYKINADGTKERVFKVGPQRKAAKKAKPAKAAEAVAEKPAVKKPTAKKSTTKKTTGDKK